MSQPENRKDVIHMPRHFPPASVDFGASPFPFFSYHLPMEKHDDTRSIKQQLLKSTLEGIKTADSTIAGHDDPCVICLDSVSERAVASPCRHYSFDFLCLMSWLQQRPTCPLCKSEVRSVEYDWHSPKDFKVYIVPPSQRREAASTLPGYRTASEARSQARRPYRLQRSSRPRLPPNPDATLRRRRDVYRDQTYSLHVGSNRLSRFRDLTPQLFNRDTELVSRARKWIRRELRVFEFLNTEGSEEGVTRRASNSEFLLEYIIAILRTVDIKGSAGQAEEMLQEFLGRENTRLFLHELRAWLRSPFTSLEDWDRNVQYKDVIQQRSWTRQDQQTKFEVRKDITEHIGREASYAPSKLASRSNACRVIDRYTPYTRPP